MGLFCLFPPHLEQEVVGVVAMVDGGDGIEDGATQHHRLTLQEHGLQHLHNNIQLSSIKLILKIFGTKRSKGEKNITYRRIWDS